MSEEAGAATPPFPTTITPYERLRLAKIARNNARLEELGLLGGGSGIDAGVTNNPKKRRRRGGDKQGSGVAGGDGSSSRRRSTSKRGGGGGDDSVIPPAPRRNPRRHRSREKVGPKNGGAEEHRHGPGDHSERGASASGTTTASLDDAAATTTIITPESSERSVADDRMIMREAATLGAVSDSVRKLREALGESKTERKEDEGEGAGDQEDDDDERHYRIRSIALWGPGCSPPPSCSWRTFYESRTTRSSKSNDSPKEILLPPTSPYNLLQETYATLSPWHLLCSCVLMSRVRSADVKIRCISGFFDLCRKPSDFSQVDPTRLVDTIHSLGFQVERTSHLAAVTEAFLTRGEFDVDDVPVERGGNKIAGCGPFAIDSYNVFFRLDVDYTMGSDDVRVRSYQRWLKRWREERERGGGTS